jgi:hypothetical protein
VSIYQIDISDIGIKWQDAGPWRSYGVESYGDSENDLLANAVVYETDQDGGEINCYALYDANTDVREAAKKKILEVIGSLNLYTN